jgi:predicted amidohydrolase
LPGILASVNSGPSTEIRVALCQAHPVLGDVDANLKSVRELATQAAAAGAQLIVLPELVTTGYVFRDKAELFDALAKGDGLDALVELSRELNIVLVAGIAQRSGNEAHNCAVLCDRGILSTTYVKAHSWDTEKAIFTAGDRLPPVVETSVGRIGLAVCYDLEFPELIRHLAVAGADIIAAPTNWPAGFESPSHTGPFNAEMIRVMGSASTNRVFIAVACRTGSERGVDWVDRSVIIGPDGYPLAEAASGIGIVYADIETGITRDNKISNNNDVLADRRTDLY